MKIYLYIYTLDILQIRNPELFYTPWDTRIENTGLAVQYTRWLLVF